VKAIETAVTKQFAADAKNIKMTSASTDGITGWLEVSVNGVLVHSKKNGDGYVNTQEKMMKIINSISNALAGRDVLPPAAAATTATADAKAQ